MSKSKRRDFIKRLSVGGIVLGGVSKGLASSQILKSSISEKLNSSNYGPNNKIQLAIIGCGIQGQLNGISASKINGIKIVAACDLYSGRLDKMKEDYGEIFTNRDYKEILAREDVDAVCVATSDHWHDYITIAALEAGKAVYCEKPMVHKLDEGQAVIKAEKKYGLPLQIGSQRATSIVTEKARQLYAEGVIGELILADIVYDRNSAVGAWQYSIPTDASTDTVSWDQFVGDAPNRSFDKKRFFRWRNYQDYGTGVAGDLFVHLFSALHVITGSIGPEKIYATGGLRYWKDGRDVPDITLGLYDYAAQATHPAFNVQMRVNFADGSGGGSRARLIGTDGVMTVSGGGIKIERNGINDQPRYMGYDAYMTFSKSQKKDFRAWFEKEYQKDKKAVLVEPKELEYSIPEGYDDHIDHWGYFADAVRNGTKLLEDGTFGLRAAGPALATNNSYFEKRIVKWDAEKMRIV